MHCSEYGRLKGLMDAWKGDAVSGGADGVDRSELDGWQKFAHDIAGRRDREEATRPVRCFLIGTAGTGKSRTVRSFVGAKRAVVRRKHMEKIDARRVLGATRADIQRMERDMNEDLRYCCRLGAPTGCASFQLKFGASTLRRLFGMGIGYCGPAANRTSEKFKIKKDRLRRARLFVLDELSMIGRMMLGKIEFQVRDHLGNQPSSDGSEVFMGNKDLVLCGDPKQCPPIGDDPMYRNGECSGRGENKPSGAQDVPPGAWSAKRLVRVGLLLRDSCQDVVILRKVHRYQDYDESVPPENRALYADEAVKFLAATRGMADCTWRRGWEVIRHGDFFITRQIL